MKRCRLFKRKHSYFFVSRRMFGLMYVFECKTCGKRAEISKFDFWDRRRQRIGAQLLWNNFGA